MAPEQLHGQATPATDIYALGATIVALAGGIEPEDVPRKGLRMDLAKHLPALDDAFRAVLIAMTDPDPDKRPQRARDVVSLLAKSKPPRESPDRDERALTKREAAEVAPRLMFADIQEPLGTVLRLAVLGFGFGGWVAMASIRLSLALVIGIATVLTLPSKKARTTLGGVRSELDEMLVEGQGGFTDLMRAAKARRRRR
jgi:hypothetical protein